MNEKMKALQEVKNLLADAWTIIYRVSKGDLESDYFKIRSDINEIEVLVYDALENEAHELSKGIETNEE